MRFRERGVCCRRKDIVAILVIALPALLLCLAGAVAEIAIKPPPFPSQIREGTGQFFLVLANIWCVGGLMLYAIGRLAANARKFFYRRKRVRQKPRTVSAVRRKPELASA